MIAAKAATKRSIQVTSSQRMKTLNQIQVKANTQSNINWAISAYNR